MEEQCEEQIEDNRRMQTRRSWVAVSPFFQRGFHGHRHCMSVDGGWRMEGGCRASCFQSIGNGKLVVCSRFHS